MPATKDDINAALKLLDPSNNQHWTDDGLPRVDAVRGLVGDEAVTRAQINDAHPGYTRTATKPQDGENDGSAQGQNVGSEASVSDKFDPDMEPEINGPGEPLTDDEVRAILERRVQRAEDGLTAARAALSQAQRDLNKAEQRVDRARADMNRLYPPLSAADNIKEFLAAQGKLALERAGLTGAATQVDLSMQRANRRGWTRPSRPVNNAA